MHNELLGIITGTGISSRRSEPERFVIKLLRAITDSFRSILFHETAERQRRLSIAIALMLKTRVRYK